MSVSRRKLKWRRKLGYPGNEDRSFQRGNDKMSVKDMQMHDSQCGGSFERLLATIPANMSRGKLRKVEQWLR